MKVQEIIIAFLFVIASAAVVFTLVFDMYGSNGYDIDLSEDASTAVLTELETNVDTARDEAGSSTNQVWNKTVGQLDATIDSGSVTEGDLMKSSALALSNMGTYVDTFTTLLTALFSAMGLGTAGPVFWFILTALIVIISFILLGAFLKLF